MGPGQGRIQPLTVVLPVRRWWSWWLRLSWPAAERVGLISRITKGPLFALGFINFAHFTLVRRAPRRRGRRFPAPVILFHTNFNGDAEAYIDAFALQVAARIRLMVAGAHRWPGTGDRGRFRAWFLGNVVPTRHHFWTAYDASAKEVSAGLELRDAFARSGLREAAAAGDDAAFAARWQAFLDEHAGRL